MVRATAVSTIVIVISLVLFLAILIIPALMLSALATSIVGSTGWWNFAAGILWAVLGPVQEIHHHVIKRVISVLVRCRMRLESR